MTPDPGTPGTAAQPPTGHVDRRLVTGGAVLMTGAVGIWLAGAALAVVALAAGGRRYLAARPEPPRETVRRRWAQTRTASGAGLRAWHEHGRNPAVG
jgi:hypothetical protein